MSVLAPSNPSELAAALADAADRKQTIALHGCGSKCRMGGQPCAAEVTIATTGLGRLLQYEPRDLTVSAEAGMPWRELARALAAEGQMIPIDPPLFSSATVGGVIASGASGPRRRLYGTARDFVIGMKFALLSGKVVQSGGMVVKNVAGLDMAKLMIGSMGTLAAVAVVNFKVVPMPAAAQTFLLAFNSPAQALEARNTILRGVLQPAAVDLLNPAAAAALGREGCLLAIGAGGSGGVLERYRRELRSVGDPQVLEGGTHDDFWAGVREFIPAYLMRAPDGAVVRVSTTLAGLREVLDTFPESAIARAGSGVAYGCFAHTQDALGWLARAAARGWKAIMEFGPENRDGLELWPNPGGDLQLCEQIKDSFDPHRLLNRGRLYHRI